MAGWPSDSNQTASQSPVLYSQDRFSALNEDNQTNGFFQNLPGNLFKGEFCSRSFVYLSISNFYFSSEATL